MYPKWHADVLSTRHEKIDLIERLRIESEERRREASLAFEKEKALILALNQGVCFFLLLIFIISLETNIIVAP